MFHYPALIGPVPFSVPVIRSEHVLTAGALLRAERGVVVAHAEGVLRFMMHCGSMQDASQQCHQPGHGGDGR